MSDSTLFYLGIALAVIGFGDVIGLLFLREKLKERAELAPVIRIVSFTAPFCLIFGLLLLFREWSGFRMLG